MLVLTRKAEEGIVIGDSIRLTVLEIKGNKIRLGIEAPPEVPIHRGELVACGALEFKSTRSGQFDLDLPSGRAGSVACL